MTIRDNSANLKIVSKNGHEVVSGVGEETPGPDGIPPPRLGWAAWRRI